MVWFVLLVWRRRNGKRVARTLGAPVVQGDGLGHGHGGQVCDAEDYERGAQEGERAGLQVEGAGVRLRFRIS